MSIKSARGLFKAMGQASGAIDVIEKSDMFGTYVVPVFSEPHPEGFYPTPPEPTRAILSAELRRLHDFPAIWEPAAGDGAMSIEMEAHGLRVIKTDLVDRGCGADIRDFYDYSEEDAPSKAVLTNPPFHECNKDPGWVRHALETLKVDYMALLLPLSWMTSGRDRAALWAQYPPSRIYVMRWRIDFTGQGAPPSAHAWYVWDKDHVEETILRVLDRHDRLPAQLALIPAK